MLEKILLVILGAFLSAVAYLVKRWFERRPTLDKLDVQAKILAITKEMRAQGLTAEDLATLEIELTDKPQAVQKHAQDLEGATQSLLEKREGVFLSQAEMNIRADHNVEVAKLKMSHVLSELKLVLDEPEKSALEKAQVAWESYCIEQAQAAAISYRGGTIYPLIYLSEIERLTVDRTARLQADLDELRKLGN